VQTRKQLLLFISKMDSEELLLHFPTHQTREDK
jgi:hypothetical protein